MCVDGSSIPLAGYVISVHSDDQFKFTNCVIDKKGVPADLFSINYSFHTPPSSPNSRAAKKRTEPAPQGLMSCQNSSGSLVNPPPHTTTRSLVSFYLYFFDDSSSFACYLLKARFFFVSLSRFSRLKVCTRQNDLVKQIMEVCVFK